MLSASVSSDGSAGVHLAGSAAGVPPSGETSNPSEPDFYPSSPISYIESPPSSPPGSSAIPVYQAAAGNGGEEGSSTATTPSPFIARPR